MSKQKGTKEISKLLLDVWENSDDKSVELVDIYLDPNNPRYMDEKDDLTPEDQIVSDAVQRKAAERLDEIGIDDLHENIKYGGFQKWDRVVVRPFENGKYVVVEGNRRIASLKRLSEEIANEGLKIDDRVKKSMSPLAVLVYVGKNKNVAVVVQGLRHINTVKKWPKSQQARFVEGLRDEKKGVTPQKVARMIGVKVADVTALIRSHNAMKQAKADEEYGDRVTTDKFSIFEEAVFKTSELKEWLGWDDDNQVFTKKDNLKKLLSWVTKDPDTNEVRIARAIDVRDWLSKLVLPENRSLLSDFESGAKDFEAVRIELVKKERTSVPMPPEPIVDLPTVKENLVMMNKSILTLPIPTISGDEAAKKVIVEQLTTLKKTIEAQIGILMK